MSIHIDREIARDLSRSAGMEWLETNGLGGWAGTTVAGLHSRRCHGLLVAATEPPGGRAVLLSRLDETLHVAGETFELSCNQFPGAIAPRGFEHLASFSKDLFPVFEYEAGGIRLRKTVAAVDGENTTLVLYEVLEAPGPFLLSLRPFVAGRHQHALAHANPALSEETVFEDSVLRLHPYADLPEVFLQVPGAELRANPHWWYRFEYELDRRRGSDFQEDLWTPGLFGRELGPGDRLGIVLSTRDPRGRDAFELLDRERRRREKVVRAVPVRDETARALTLAADGFLVRRGSVQGEQKGQRAVVAAYPAPGERSRDTMIALPGLCLATGRYEEAKKILRTFARGLEGGLFPGDTSVDASLWFFVAGYRFFKATDDEAFTRGTLLPALRKVIHAYDRGTLHDIKADEDGLLLANEPEIPLTWMDAVVAGRPVTSRAGKAVEVQALWHNALCILAELEARLGDPAEANWLEKRARRVQKRFADLFWDE
ncbi:MAG TPA: glycogen debranching enzyme N-terminal domain-containing protein, partial [Thermoanaerobaculia bacterium]|nr:glycogen debranching enzyme N-terminal domain-containing protein [Thermoanaerobaculia bacterium]